MYVLFFGLLRWIERWQARRDIVAAAVRACDNHQPHATLLPYSPEDLDAIHSAVRRLHEFGG